MIFTVRPVQMTRLISKSPLKDFALHSLLDHGKENFKRENYFIRYIGFDEGENEYLTALKEMEQKLKEKEGYLRVEGLLRYFKTDKTSSYIAMYDEWLKKHDRMPQELIQLPFPMAFQNPMMALTERVAFDKVMAIYSEHNGAVSASIKKNFAVSLLGLIDYFLPMIFSKEEIMCGKIVYIGEVKKQELYFLLYLNLLGCDILYIHPEKDIKEKYPECQAFSDLYEGRNKKRIDVMKSLDEEEAKKMQLPTRNSESATHHVASHKEQEVATKENDQKNTDHHGSIHLEHAHAAMGERRQVPRNYERELSYEELARFSTSVVMIGIVDRYEQVLGRGSGVVINKEGYILTNYHVVQGGVRYLVKFEDDEQTYETTRVIKYHPELDLAIIKVERNCVPIEVYGGNQIVRGQKVVAIGSPLGFFNSISEGIISGFRETQDGSIDIQFTAPVSPGSSGGALLDLYGRLIGISTAVIIDGQNINMAVGSDSVIGFAGNYIHRSE